MSHNATVKTELRNRKMIVKAAAALGLPCTTGDFKETLYDDSEPVTGDVRIELPGWNYLVIINKTTGEAHYDNYNGSWGDIAELEKLQQEYALQIAEDEAQEFVLQGWTVSRQPQPNGDIQVVIEQ